MTTGPTEKREFIRVPFNTTVEVRVQDRVIRLEMHLRMLQLVPDLGPRFGEFTIDQLCSLRFASDAELPELARKVLAEKLVDRAVIKKMVREWQADHLRA